MKTNYELFAQPDNLDSAKSIFSQDFATRAFEAGAHRPRGRRADHQREDPLPEDVIRWIVEFGRPRLALACFSYFFVVERRYGIPKPPPFLNSVRQIRDSAIGISDAANAIADQIARHFTETHTAQVTGEVDQVRYRTLWRLASALNRDLSEQLSPDQFKLMMKPVLNLDERFGLRVDHSLQSCSSLGREADQLLEDYNCYAAAMRTADRPALQGKPGNRHDNDQNAFIADLAMIYESGLGERPSAKRGSDATVGWESPFVRFVKQVFDELQMQSFARELPSQYKMPSVDVINRILKRDKLATEACNRESE